MTSLLSIPYRSTNGSTATDEYCLEYSPHDPTVEHIKPTMFANEQVNAIFSKYTISTDDSFVPERLEVRVSRSGNRRADEDTRRVIVLGKDHLHYKVFKYPAPPLYKVSDENEDISMS